MKTKQQLKKLTSEFNETQEKIRKIKVGIKDTESSLATVTAHNEAEKQRESKFYADRLCGDSSKNFEPSEPPTGLTQEKTESVLAGLKLKLEELEAAHFKQENQIRQVLSKYISGEILNIARTTYENAIQELAVALRGMRSLKQFSKGLLLDVPGIEALYDTRAIPIVGQVADRVSPQSRSIYLQELIGNIPGHVDALSETLREDGLVPEFILDGKSVKDAQQDEYEPQAA